MTQLPSQPDRTRIERALSAARNESVWHRDLDARLTHHEPLSQSIACDLAIVGAGLTGLWTAILAREQHPDLSICLIDAHDVGYGASSRNGGFISESLTHGLSHGLAMWPDELPLLLELGRLNFREIQEFLAAEGADVELQPIGKTAVATRPHEVESLRQTHELHLAWGEDSTFLDADQVRADINSPTYLAGMRLRTGSGLVNPAKLLNALCRAALSRGVTIYTQTPVASLRESAEHVELVTPSGSVSAKRVVLATNAFTPLKSSIRHRVMPIFDHVLATRCLTDAELASLGWAEGQGVTDSGNQFHYYRKTSDNRILWGGYDANYYFGNDTSPAREQRRSSHELLAAQFFETFPTLADVTFDYAWAGLIDSTSRFTPFYEVSRGGRVGTAVGFTGLGVGSSRFAAKIILDLLWRRQTTLTALEMVRRRPIPVPPEPLRFPIIAFTRWMLTREDRSGRRGLYLKLLDRFGVGFNS